MVPMTFRTAVRCCRETSMRLFAFVVILTALLTVAEFRSIHAEEPSSGPSEFYKVLPRKDARSRKAARQNLPPERTGKGPAEDESKIDTSITVELLVGSEGTGLNA